MVYVFFEDRNKNMRFVDKLNVADYFDNQVNLTIRQYIEKLNPNYTIYYTRNWFDSTRKDTVVVDVGSYTEFFYVSKHNIVEE